MKKRGVIYFVVLFSSFLYSQENKKQTQLNTERDVNFITDTNWTWRDVLDEVIITGQLKEVRVENAVHDIKIITSDVIESGLFSDLSQLLIFDNNIKMSNDNILGPALSFQGISGQNVKILIDGIPVIGRLNGNIDISQINLNNIERIEIVEGPLSVDLGSDALAGTINIITKKMFEDSWTSIINNYYETVGKYNNDIFLNYQRNNHMFSNQFRRDFFSGWSEEDNFHFLPTSHLADEKRFKKWKPKEKLYNKLQYGLKKERIHIRNYVEYFYEKITNRGLPREPYFNNAFDDYYHTNRLNFGSDIEFFIDEYKIKSLFAYNRYKRIKNTFYKDLTNLQQVLVEDNSLQDTMRFNMLMFKFLSYSQYNNIDYQIGVDITNQDSQGDRIERGYQYQTDYAIFSNLEINIFDRFMLRPGFRMIYNNKYTAPIIPSLNFLYRYDDKLQKDATITLRGSYAKGFRAPSLKELFLYFVDINHNIIGNPDLLAEKGDNFRLSTSYTLKKEYEYNSKLSLFYNDIQNKISLNSINDEYSYFNIDRYKTLGLTLDLAVSNNNYSFNTSASYIGRYNDLPSDLDYPKFNYSLDYNISFLLNITPKTKLVSFYKYNGSTSAFSMNEDNQIVESMNDAYSLLDLSFSKKFVSNKLIINIGAKNIFNITDINILQNDLVHTNSSNTMSIGYGRTFFTNIKLIL